MFSISYNFGATVRVAERTSQNAERPPQNVERTPQNVTARIRERPSKITGARDAIADVRHSTDDSRHALTTSNRVDLSQEKQLVESAKTNMESFGRLYDFYFPKVYAFVAAKIFDRDDAEDITGDIFMKVLENLGNFEWRGVPFGAWVFRIARNTLNDYYGRSAKTRTTDIDTAYGVSEDEEKTSPHKKAAREELADKVKEILGGLPERELNVIRLKFFSEMTNREIMHITGLSESNVAVIIYRTLKKIKPDLKYFA